MDKYLAGMSVNISVNVLIIIAKIGDWVKRHQRDIWTGLCLVLIGWSAYNVGVIRGYLATTAPTQEDNISEQVTPQLRAQAVPEQAKAPAHTDPRVIVSKSSTSKKYHYTWCTSGQRIKEENKVWFPTAQAAEAAGYTLAGNCQP